MAEKVYQPGESYDYPLIIKKLLNTPLIYSPEREIVYAGVRRYNYRTLNERDPPAGQRPGSAGPPPGETVAVLDYDSHRYLECFFAVPMLGAVLQTVNWRLSPDQIAYTLKHAGARIILTHVDFVPVLERIEK